MAESGPVALSVVVSIWAPFSAVISALDFFLLRSREDLDNTTAFEPLTSSEQFRHNSWGLEMVFHVSWMGIFG